jgi:hypothetical protein
MAPKKKKPANKNSTQKRKKKQLKAGSVDGRPKLEINFEIVKKLCAIQCTGEEIAGVIGVSYDTVVARIQEEYGITFPEYIKRHSPDGKVSLRRKQYQVAMNGNATMLIWLGKQYLNQREEVAHTFEEPIPVEIIHPKKKKVTG